MKVLKVEHKDFELVIECNDLVSTFNKAKLKQTRIDTSTTYTTNEGDISIYNFNLNQLVPYQNNKTYPLIFENKDYFIGVTFKNKKSLQSATPAIYSRLKEVEEKFFFREELGFLAGTINYGNDLGKSEINLRYTKENKIHEFNLQFEVFPTKLDYKTDYDKIIADIEKEYPYLVLDFLKKTYTSFKTGNSPNTDLIWWQVFGGLYKDFIKASKFILNKPHSRIIRQIQYSKADKIKKWSSNLEDEFSQFKNLPNRYYRSEYKALTTNTSENKFFKHAVIQSLRRFKRVKSYIEINFSNISNSFKREIESIERQFEIISANPFFRTIEDFRGIKQESLVLHKATGYSTIYKCWIMLNSGLKFLDGIQKIELKNIADLYQIWCFLEIKNVLQKLLGKEKPEFVDLAEIQIDDFIFKIEKGVKSKVSFKNDNGELIELFHDLPFESSTYNGLKSFTVNQRPDIVLRITKNDLKDNYVLTYLYDAKYRLASDEKEGAPDLPPEDAINQMHRYRDAIYYVNKDNSNKPEKEVIGAYILFPGSGELNSIKNSDYYKSIDAVNIGAFPLKPNDYQNRILLEEHLSLLLGMNTENVLNDVAPQKLNSYESPNPEVLIGIVPSDLHALCFINNDSPFYFTGKAKPNFFGYKKLRYFAPYIQEKGIQDYYEILNYEIKTRNKIFKKGHKLYKPEDYSERLVLKLGKKNSISTTKKSYKLIGGRIRHFRYTKLNFLRNPIFDKIEVLKVGS